MTQLQTMMESVTGNVAGWNDPQVDAAAISHDASRYYELALRLAGGREGRADLVEAHKWLNIAVARGYAPAVQRRAELALEMSRADIAAAQREARLWLTRH
jgi:TPR repeat protein